MLWFFNRVNSFVYFSCNHSSYWNVLNTPINQIKLDMNENSNGLEGVGLSWNNPIKAPCAHAHCCVAYSSFFFSSYEHVFIKSYLFLTYKMINGGDCIFTKYLNNFFLTIVIKANATVALVYHITETLSRSACKQICDSDFKV